MNFIPRDYQIAAKDAAFDFLRNRTGSPCIEIPTGGGKAWIIAMICKDAFEIWQGRVLILAHVKELLNQTAEKLIELAPEVPVGMYSAGLKRRDTNAPVIVAGIQSVYDKAQQLGTFDLILIDEAHLIPESGDGMYRTLIADLLEINPDMRVIGLTATPYRLSSGALCSPDNILTDICYTVGVKQLINRGYLSKVVGKAAVAEINTDLLKIVRGEYEAAQTEAAFDPIIDAAVGEILAATYDRKSTIIFCQSVAHAQRVTDTLRLRIHNSEAMAEECLKAAASKWGELALADDRLPMVADWLEENDLPFAAVRFYLAMGHRRVSEIYGNTDDDERDTAIKQFKAGWNQYLVNVNVLTTGFDAPNVDCVVLLRATASAGLMYQMIGRGFRLSPGKENCLVLDFGTNIERHGPVDCLKPHHQKKTGKSANDLPAGKVCPECRSVNAQAVSVCLDCGFAFPMPEHQAPTPSHDGRASNADVVSGEPTLTTYDVRSTTYKIHRKKGGDENTPRTLRVDYEIGAYQYVSEWVCIEHTGFARGKAEAWWKKRSRHECPHQIAEAILIADSGLLASPETVTVKRKPDPKSFPEIVGHELGDIPEAASVCPFCRDCNKRTYFPDPDGRYAGLLVCEGCGSTYRHADELEIEFWGFQNEGPKKAELNTTNNLPANYEDTYADEIPF